MPHPIAETGDCAICRRRALVYSGALDENDVEHPACRECIERGLARCVPISFAQQRQQYATQAHHGTLHGGAGDTQRPLQGVQLQQKNEWGGHQPCAHTPCADGTESITMVCGAQRVAMAMLCRKRPAGGAAVEWGGEVYECVGVTAQQVLAGQGGCEAVQSSPQKRQRTAVPFSTIF